jgi:hypothetical protein
VLFREIGHIGGRRAAFVRRHDLPDVTKPDEHAPEEEQSPFVEQDPELGIVRRRERAPWITAFLSRGVVSFVV